MYVYWVNVTPVWKGILWLKWSFILSFTLCVAFLLAGPAAEILQPFLALALFAFLLLSLLACHVGCGLHPPGPGSCSQPLSRILFGTAPKLGLAKWLPLRPKLDSKVDWLVVFYVLFCTSADLVVISTAEIWQLHWQADLCEKGCTNTAEPGEQAVTGGV